MYTYDAAGRLSRVENGSGSLFVAYQYDSVGRVAREDRGNDTAVVTTYDPMGGPPRDTHRPGGTPISQFSTTYDAKGNPTSVTSNEGTVTYEYDGRGQLLSATGLAATRWSTHTMPRGTGRIVDNGAPTDYVINSLNQITAAGSESFTYDGDGNLASRTGPRAV